MNGNPVTAPAEEQPAVLTIVELKQAIGAMREQSEVAATTVAQVAELTELKRALDKEIGTVKESLAPREDALLEEFAIESVTSKRDEGTGKLVYRIREVWAGREEGVEMPRACAALQANGLGDYVNPTFNTRSLSSYFKEEVARREADGEVITDVSVVLPEELRGFIRLTAKTKVGVKG